MPLPREGARASILQFRGEGLIVLSVPTTAESGVQGLAALTGSEWEVAQLARRGLSNREIAVLRGSAERTVANQMASILRKLKVGSRWEIPLGPAISGPCEDDLE